MVAPKSLDTSGNMFNIELPVNFSPPRV